MFYIINRTIRTCMHDRKYEMYFFVEQDISLVRFAHLRDILVNTRNKFHISTHPCIILYIFHQYNIDRSPPSLEEMLLLTYISFVAFAGAVSLKLKYSAVLSFLE